MRSLLQYAYSILVFAGVLGAAYFALNKEGSEPLPLRSVHAPTPSFRSDATVVDPAVTQLFEMEDALSRLDPADKSSRMPSRIEIILPAPLTRRPQNR